MIVHLLQICLVFIFLSCGQKNNKQSSDSEVKVKNQIETIFWNVGYKDNSPLFFETNQKKFFLLDENLVLRETSVVYTSVIEFSNNCGYAEIGNDGSKLLIRMYGSDNSSQFEIEGDLYGVSLSENCKMVAFSLNEKVLLFNSNNSLLYEANGHFPQIINDKLYYLESEQDAFVSIYEYDFLSMKKRRVLTNVYEEGVLILKKGEYIACEIPIDGKAKKVIYNIEEKRYSVIESTEIQEGNYFPIEHKRKEALLYYKPKGLVIKEIQFPKTFDNVRQ